MNNFTIRVIFSLSLLLGLAGCHRSPEDRSARYISRGKTFIAQKDYHRALLELKNAIKATPANAEGHYQLGIAYAGTGDVNSAVLSFLKAVELNPEHKEAQLKLALLLEGSRNPALIKDAEKRLKEVLAANSGDSDALYELGLAELKLGNAPDAIDLLNRSIDNVARLDSSVALANLKLSQKDFKGAEIILRRAVQQLPKSADARVALARYFVVAAKPAEAEIEYRRALEIDPRNPVALNDFGLFMLRMNRTEEAEKSFRNLAALPDKRYQAVHALFLSQIGKRDQAVAELQQLYKQDPNDRYLRNLLVLGYNLTNRFAEAENIVNAVLKKNAKDSDALEQRARIRLAAGRLDDAQSDLTETLRLRPDSGRAHYLLAKTHLAKGATGSYQQELNEALRVDPTLLEVRVELSSVLRETKSAKSALELMDRAPGHQKRQPAYLAERNWVLLAVGDQAKSRAGIDFGLHQNTDATFLLQDAVWKMRDGQAAAARTSLENALTAQPENTQALRLLAVSYFKEKKVQESVARVRAQAGKFPKSARLQMFLGDWLQATGDATGSREAYTAAKAQDPSRLAADLALAKLDYRQGNLDGARQLLLPLLPANNSNQEIILLLGMVEDSDRHADAAIAYYQKVVSINPDNLRALNNLAWHLAEDRKQTDQALQMAQHAQELAPQDPQINDTLGWILYQKGLYPSAGKQFQNALAHDSAPLYQYHLAMAYLQSGNRKKGAETLEAALKQNPNLPEAKIASALMSQQQ